MHFNEKSVWSILLSELVIYGAYFAVVFSIPAEMDGGRQLAFFMFVGAVVAQVVVLVIAHVVLALTSLRDNPGAEDERDKRVWLRSSRNGAWVTDVGVIMLVMVLIGGAAFGGESGGWGAFGDGLFVGNVLLAMFVLAEVVTRVSQLVYYRRGL